MKKWGAQLRLQEPTVNPTARHAQLALGFGILAAPCPCVELNGNPGGGVTRVILPFMALEGLVPDTDGSDRWTDFRTVTRIHPRNTVEPMLEGFATVVWNLATCLCPNKIEGAKLQTVLRSRTAPLKPPDATIASVVAAHASAIFLRSANV